MHPHMDIYHASHSARLLLPYATYPQERIILHHFDHHLRRSVHGHLVLGHAVLT